MVNEVKEIDLPDWFNGEVYKQGANVKNPYSGESCYLNAKELSIYDFIKGSEVLNPEGVRFPDEMVRHKILDMIGDLSLIGSSFVAHIIAIKSGHAANHLFGKELKNILMRSVV